jgi:hypothetical protein
VDAGAAGIGLGRTWYAGSAIPAATGAICDAFGRAGISSDASASTDTNTRHSVRANHGGGAFTNIGGCRVAASCCAVTRSGDSRTPTG